MDNTSRELDEWRGMLALSRRAAGLFERHNIFYLISALLMLMGCFMLSLPLLTRPTQWTPLLKLLGTVNLYEALVVLACGYILRRDAHNREGWVLLLIEILFLFDLTMTIGACLPGHLYGGMWIAAASLALAVAKLYAIERGAAYPVFRHLRWFIVAALCYQYGFPSWMAHAAEMDQPFRQYTSFLIWTGLGGVVLTLFACDLFAETPESSASFTPLWRRSVFRLALVVLVFALLLLQTIAQSYVLAAPFYWQALVPLLLAALSAYPAFEPNAPRSQLNLFRWPLSIALLLMVYVSVEYRDLWGIMNWNGATAPESMRLHAPLVLSPLRVNLLFAALCYGLLAWREDNRTFRHAAFLAAALALVCYDRPSLHRFLHEPLLHSFAPLALLWSAWCFLDRRYVPAFVTGMIWAYLFARGLSSHFNDRPSTTEWLWYAPALAFFLGLVLKAPHRYARPLTLTTVLMLGIARSEMTSSADGLFYVTGLVTLAAGAWVQPKPWAFALVVYAAAANLRAFRVAASATPKAIADGSWAWVFIFAAFVVFALAFFFTRRRLSHPGVDELRPSPPL